MSSQKCVDLRFYVNLRFDCTSLLCGLSVVSSVARDHVLSSAGKWATSGGYVTDADQSPPTPSLAPTPASPPLELASAEVAIAPQLMHTTRPKEENLCPKEPTDSNASPAVPTLVTTLQVTASAEATKPTQSHRVLRFKERSSYTWSQVVNPPSSVANLNLHTESIHDDSYYSASLSSSVSVSSSFTNTLFVLFPSCSYATSGPSSRTRGTCRRRSNSWLPERPALPLDRSANPRSVFTLAMISC